MDPELQGPDPVWKAILSGKGHVYYALAAVVILAVAVDAGAPRWLDSIAAALAAGVLADCWSHQFLH